MTQTQDAAGRLSRVQALGLAACTVLCLLSFDLALVKHDAVGMTSSPEGFALARATFLHEAVPTVLGLLLTGFLWLSLTGWFDREPRRRQDQWAWVPLAIALGLRLGVVPRSIEEIEVHLYDGVLPTMHSYVVPLLGRVLRGLPGDGHEHAFLLAGLLSAAATWPIYQFVARRSGSVAGGVLAAMAYACHPVVARFGPTDAPYSLMLYTFFVAVAALSSATPSVVAGLLSLALAVSCRADGALLVPVALLLIGPTTLRDLWLTQRRALVVGVTGATMLCGVALLNLIGSQYADENMTAKLVGLMPSVSPGRLLHDTLAHGPSVWDTDTEAVARRIWQGLALLGGLAGLWDRRLRWASAAVVGAVILAAPYEPFSWVWPVALHRVVPASAMLALAAGGGLAAIASLGSRLGATARGVVLAVAVATPLALAIVAAPFLTRLWSFNVEWEMVRAALAPQGREDRESTVMAFGARERDDLDIHDFGQMLYGVDMFECWRQDCVEMAHHGGRIRYIRGLRCFATPERVSAACADPNLSGADAVATCLIPECAAVEAALQLRPIQERTFAPAPTFEGAPMRVHLPTVAVVGVYDVVGVRP